MIFVKFLVDELPYDVDILENLEYKWLEIGNKDGYTHHYCSHCGVDAINYPVMKEDFDENFDGELYSTGFMQTGIHEFLTPYCPYCGAKLSIDNSNKNSY